MTESYKNYLNESPGNYKDYLNQSPDNYKDYLNAAITPQENQALAEWWRTPDQPEPKPAYTPSDLDFISSQQNKFPALSFSPPSKAGPITPVSATPGTSAAPPIDNMPPLSEIWGAEENKPKPKIDWDKDWRKVIKPHLDPMVQTEVENLMSLPRGARAALANYLNYTNLFGLPEYLSKKGLHPVEWFTGQKGRAANMLKAAQYIQENMNQADPLNVERGAELLTNIGKVATEFAAPAALVGKGMKALRAAKDIKSGANLAEKLIQTGTTFATHTAMQAPREDETVADRLRAIRGSALTGGAVGLAGKAIPKTAIRAPVLAGGFAAAAYAETGDPEAAIEAAVTVLGFEALGAIPWAKAKVRSMLAGKKMVHVPKVLNEVETEIKNDVERARASVREGKGIPEDLLAKYQKVGEKYDTQRRQQVRGAEPRRQEEARQLPIPPAGGQSLAPGRGPQKQVIPGPAPAAAEKPTAPTVKESLTVETKPAGVSEKQPWAMTKEEAYQDYVNGLNKESWPSPAGGWNIENISGREKLEVDKYHADDIKYALEQGKPVPPEVLADYPDLQAAPPPAERTPAIEPSEAKPGEKAGETVDTEAYQVAKSMGALLPERIKLTEKNAKTLANQTRKKIIANSLYQEMLIDAKQNIIELSAPKYLVGLDKMPGEVKTFLQGRPYLRSRLTTRKKWQAAGNKGQPLPWDKALQQLAAENPQIRENGDINYFLDLLDKSAQQEKKYTNLNPDVLKAARQEPEIDILATQMEMLLEGKTKEEINNAIIDIISATRRHREGGFVAFGKKETPGLKEVPGQKVDQKQYEANRNMKPSSTGGIITKSKEALDKTMGVISTRLGNINPKLKLAVRKFSFAEDYNRIKNLREVAPLIKKTHEMDPKDAADFDLARKNGDAAKLKQIIIKYRIGKEYHKVRKVLDSLFEKLVEVGVDVNYLKHQHPRMIKDAKGFLDFVYKIDDWPVIQQAIKAKEAALGRPMDTEQKISFINTMLRGYRFAGIGLSRPSAAKQRTVEIVDAELNRFYYDANTSLIRYIHTMNTAVAARKFFGKQSQEVTELLKRKHALQTRLSNLRSNPPFTGEKKYNQIKQALDDLDKIQAEVDTKVVSVDDSVGAMLLDMISKGEITASQEQEVKQILNARFNPRGMHGVLNVARNLALIDVLGSIRSAITQIGDLAFAVYVGGWRAVPAMTRATINKSKISRHDFAVEHILQEFVDSSKSAKAVALTLKMVGMNRMDTIGKETLVDSYIDKTRAMVKKGDKQFEAELKRIFGDEADSVISDLKEGKKTENVMFLAYNKLSDFQPISLSEVPETYLTAGNGRIFYMLKTWNIKLLDVFRNEAFQLMFGKGNSKVTRLKGLKNLIVLAALVTIAEATADEIKNLIFNRKMNLRDTVIENILDLIGFNRYRRWRIKSEGLGKAIGETIMPPFPALDNISKDVYRLYKEDINTEELKNLKTWRNVPFMGELYYWWHGKGTKSKSSRKYKPKQRPNYTF